MSDKDKGTDAPEPGNDQPESQDKPERREVVPSPRAVTSLNTEGGAEISTGEDSE